MLFKKYIFFLLTCLVFCQTTQVVTLIQELFRKDYCQKIKYTVASDQEEPDYEEGTGFKKKEYFGIQDIVSPCFYFIKTESFSLDQHEGLPSDITIDILIPPPNYV